MLLEAVATSFDAKRNYSEFAKQLSKDLEAF
jgi:hypothetical protein